MNLCGAVPLIAAKVVVGIHLGSSHSRTRGRASNEAKFVDRCSLAASTVGVILLNTPLVPTCGKRLALNKILVPTGACYCKAGRIGKWGCLLIGCHWKYIQTVRATSLQKICFGYVVALLCIVICIRQLPMMTTLLNYSLWMLRASVVCILAMLTWMLNYSLRILILV